MSLVKRAAWTKEDDEILRRFHGRETLADTAVRLGRSRSSLRARVTRLGISKKPEWTEEEVEAVLSAYSTAGPDGVLDLKGLSEKIGRHPANIVRKAKSLGCQTNPCRRIVEARRVRVAMFNSPEERARATSRRVKRWMAENKHPRGMAGKRHSPESLLKISEASKATWAAMTEEERAAQCEKAYRGAVMAGKLGPSKTARGSWKAGWREVGGKRNYYRSRWEANYARYLEWLKAQGQIWDWAHEPETFWFDAIKRGVRSYKPDFRVWENDGSSALHEVKGWMDSRSKTTLRRMAKYHPSEKIVLIDGRQYRAIRMKVMGLIPDWEDSHRDARE